MPSIIKISYILPPTWSNGHEILHLSFDISDLLAVIGHAGKDWTWALFPMGESAEIFGKEELYQDGLSLWEYCKQVDETEDGLQMSWEQFRTFTAAVETTSWGTYIACADQRSFSLLKAQYLDPWCYVDRATEKYYALTELVFQAVDDSYWLVYIKDDAILKRIASAFHNIEILRTW